MKCAMCKVKIVWVPRANMPSFPTWCHCLRMINSDVCFVKRTQHTVCKDRRRIYKCTHNSYKCNNLMYTREHLHIIAHENRAKSTLAVRERRECECEFVFTHAIAAQPSINAHIWAVDQAPLIKQLTYTPYATVCAHEHPLIMRWNSVYAIYTTPHIIHIKLCRASD